ncbi:uncharacterized protein EDB91DRAFT_570694 [Suillus paluster]|uniref:uncharacterized protein n=1 Tax=Suillus paluster TaxID=48578 RepID=UPI001B880FD4|nr:uncharacterized protein EDB91DRAFT_570694 [Suillus paluster]KAG1735134.1 hypothetical protein EDB91DRAFT_570694 [Suillus paluster]
MDRTGCGLRTGKTGCGPRMGRTGCGPRTGKTGCGPTGGSDWLQTRAARDWLQTPHGQAWQSTPGASFWVAMEEFSGTLQAINKYTIIPELPLLPAVQAIQQFKSLPDFMMFPAVLALMYRDHSVSAFPQGHFTGMEIIHAMEAFESFANEARERGRTTSDALKYACQHWAIHLSRAPNPWDDTVNHIFLAFWNRHLLSWLERQWCLKGLPSCLVILSEGQKLVKAVSVNVQCQPSIPTLKHRQ